MMRQWAPILAHAAVSVASIVSQRDAPTITLDDATVTGSNLLVVDKFLGIPFGKAPCVAHSYHLCES